MITTIRRRTRSRSLSLPAVSRSVVLVALRIVLTLQRCCPLHHHTAAHAFSFGSSPAPSSSFLAALHHPSLCSASRGREAGCRASHQNGIPTTTICFTANIDATSEEGLYYDTGSSSSSDSTFRNKGRSKTAGSKKVLRATAAVSSKGKDLRPARGKTRIGWEAHFQKLVQFKELHGHCRVPQNYTVDDVNLGTWVNTQRQHYKKYLAGKYSPMTQERIDALEKIGFEWKLYTRIGWEDHFQKLVQFKDLHGHFQVPQNYTVDNVRLGNWVNKQRQHYRKFKRGQKSQITQKRIDALETIDFNWGTAITGWEEHFQKLVQFKELNGHCRAPRNYTVDKVNLGNWVSFQRQEYLRLRDGQYSTMTQERMDALNAIGFDWGKAQIGWEAQLRLLQEFQKENGHCQVPPSHSVDNVNLGTWVANQRQNYRKFQDGKPSSMTQERINQLNAIDFKWKVYDV